MALMPLPLPPGPHKPAASARLRQPPGNWTRQQWWKRPNMPTGLIGARELRSPAKRANDLPVPSGVGRQIEALSAPASFDASPVTVGGEGRILNGVVTVGGHPIDNSLSH